MSQDIAPRGAVTSLSKTTDRFSRYQIPDDQISDDVNQTSYPRDPIPAIETSHLSRTVPGRTLVDDVSVAVEKGEILAIVGPSGAGKSSFLRLLNRLDEPTKGTVRLDGRDYHGIATADVRRRLGMVLQSPYLFAGTVALNLSFGPAQRKLDFTLPEIGALLNEVGLAGYEDRDVATLSGGEAQRVSLARTLANNPGALLLDEPTSALDGDNVLEIEDLIQKINAERRMTCVIVTHNRDQALRLAHRTMYMANGKAVVIGLTKDVLSAH